MEIKRDAAYTKSIEDFFAAHFKKNSVEEAIECESPRVQDQGPNGLTALGTREKCVSTKGIRGLQGLPCFRYHVIPAQKKSKGHVIRFQGGPADILEFSRFQLDEFEIITFNDLGVGSNSFPVSHRTRWQDFGEANQALILERILKQENAKRYVLYGGSYGSVTATTLGKILSSGKNPPLGILFVGVVPGAADRQSAANVLDSTESSSAKVDSPGKEVCILREKRGCSDESFLKLLSEVERTQFLKKVSDLAADSKTAPLFSLIKDALHWEYVHSPSQAASFVKRYLLSGKEAARMKCWYDREFINIPWLNRFKSASQFAFYNVHSCFISSLPEDREKSLCSCFAELPSYRVSDYQIQPPTQLFYVNGEFDPQTPLKGAYDHFSQQASKEKTFLKVCGAGHLPVRDKASPTDRTLSANEIFGKIFSKDASSFQEIGNFCESPYTAEDPR